MNRHTYRARSAAGCPMTPHCDDRSRDRAKGDATEAAFKATMEAWGYPVELHPRDLDMWVDARAWPYPTLHEIKGKKPTAGGCFGLEKYRLAALLRHDETTPTFYTVHNDATKEWVTVRVSRLPMGRLSSDVQELPRRQSKPKRASIGRAFLRPVGRMAGAMTRMEPIDLNPQRISFEAHGKPQPAGSKRAFPIRRKGWSPSACRDRRQPAPKDGKPAVAAKASEVMGTDPLLDGPLGYGHGRSRYGARRATSARADAGVQDSAPAKPGRQTGLHEARSGGGRRLHGRRVGG
jgi:hypothetical protein